MNQETTPHLYSSPDTLVVIRILDHPRRWPDHNYKCVVARVKPKEHERVRKLDDDVVEIMFTKAEVKALLDGWGQCDPDFQVRFEKPMTNKPEQRRELWRSINHQRVNQRRFYRTHRSRRRS